MAKKPTTTKAKPRAAKSPAKAAAKKTAGGSQNKDFKTLGGFLLACYWISIIGGVLLVLSLVPTVLLLIGAGFAYESAGMLPVYTRLSFAYGPIYTAGALVSMVSVIIMAVFFIIAAFQLKARNSAFFDTIVLGMLISLAGSIVSSLLMIRGAYGAAGFISSIIWGAIGFAISMGLAIMYFSKSVRVKVYFSGRPLHASRHWGIIKRLPNFIISEKPLW